MSELIISVSGMRGIVGSQLTPEVVVRYLGAFAEFLPPGRLVVTRDGRSTGGMIADVTIAALRAAGRDVLCPGIAATPTTGVLVRKKQCIGGVQITASHNPAEYNGLKLMDSDGRVISAAKGEHVLRNYEAHSCRWADHKHVGDVIDVPDAINEHLQMVLATVNVNRIREHQYSVLLDSNHGAGSILGKVLLERLGCRVRALGDTPDGHFEHPAEPTAENLATVLPEVVAGQADVGFCQDPDADRLAVIDETGRYVGEEYTLALCVDHVLRERPGPIVTNCSTSRMSRDLAEQHDVPFRASPVGEPNVTGVMIEEAAVFGGEGNGGPIDPRVGYVRDSFVGMASILDAMAARDEPVSSLVDGLPHYAIHKTKIELDRNDIPSAFHALAAHFNDATHDRMDGLHLDWPDRWLLVRASNTEPIVRAIAEAPTEQDAADLCQQAAEIISDL